MSILRNGGSRQRQTEEPSGGAGHRRDVQGRHVEIDEHRAARATSGAHAAAALGVVREVRVPGDAEPAAVARQELDAVRAGLGLSLRRRDGNGGLLLALAAGGRYRDRVLGGASC